MSFKWRLPIFGQKERPPDDLEVEAMDRAQQSRRSFLRALGTAGAAAATAATGCSGGAWEDFFRQHYHRLDDEDRRAFTP